MHLYFKYLFLAFATLFLLLGGATDKAQAQSQSQAQPQPETFQTLATGGAGGWLNVTRPLTVSDMAGRMVLLDFWTYGCINCMHVVPDLKYLEETFGDKLLVISVHSAKFKAEQGNERILAAAKRFGLNHPVINDSDYAIWREFGIRAWPSFVLLGPDGDIIARYSGEGHRDKLARDIRKHVDQVTNTAPVAALIPSEEGAGERLLSFPARIIYAPDLTTYFIADSGHNRVLGISPDGAVSWIIGSGREGLVDGTFETARFTHPRGLAYSKGLLYVADTDNHALRLVDLAKGTVETLAGTGGRGYNRRAQNQPARQTALASPWALEFLADGRLAIANAGTHQLWAYDPAQKTLSVLAGSGGENIDDGKAGRATLAQPSALSRVGDALYFADAESSSLRVLKDGRVKTLIGTGLFDFGLVDGSYPKAMMQHPQGLDADEAGNKIYIADSYNNAIRVYDIETGALSTLSLEGGSLNEPGDILVTGTTALIADTNNHAIKKLDLTTGMVTLFSLHEPEEAQAEP